MQRVAINGFGRIGRMVCRRMLQENTLQVAAINASYTPEMLAHLFMYDSVHGPYQGKVEYDEKVLIIDGQRIQVVNNRNPLELPWNELSIDIVIEATGKFKTTEEASKHIMAGAKKVIITAPAKDDTPMFVVGVNESAYNNEAHHVISNASCTTNALAPIVKVLDETLGIENGLMTTVHAYTNDQNNIDNPHKDMRRARACGQSIIPTSTGAAKAIGKVLPHLKGKLNGIALRVPTPNVSVIDLVIDTKKATSVEEVNTILEEAALKEYRGIIGYTNSPLVSIDFNGNDNSSIVDSLSTMVLGENKVKILAWYDNEWGYSSRVVDLVKVVANKMTSSPINA